MLEYKGPFFSMIIPLMISINFFSMIFIIILIRGDMTLTVSKHNITKDVEIAEGLKTYRSIYMYLESLCHIFQRSVLLYITICSDIAIRAPIL